MRAQTQDKTKKQRILYINRQTGKPEKMELQDTNQKTVVYILYNEITVNG